MIELTVDIEIPLPVADVWAVVADYGQDPRWRRGVVTMAPEPGGIVRVGTTTREVMKFAGKTYRNDGEVTHVDDGRQFAWRTTSGIDAHGSRTVERVDESRTRFIFCVQIHPHALERVAAPILRRVLRRVLMADLARLNDLLVAEEEVRRRRTD